MAKQIPEQLHAASNYFKWSEISRKFSGTRAVLNKNFISAKHYPVILEMIQAVDDVLRKHNIK